MKNKIVKLFGSFVCIMAVFGSMAGPIPFTQNQFPVWYGVQSVPQSAVSNANEIVLFQQAIPPYLVGNNGFFRFTLFEGSPDAAAATVTHAIKVYLGGTNAALGSSWGAVGLTAGTAIFTNTFTTTTAVVPIQAWVFPNNSAVSNVVIAPTTTNSWNAQVVTNAVSIGTQTNGLFLTITGSAGGTGGSTNVVTLQSVIVEAFSQQ